MSILCKLKLHKWKYNNRKFLNIIQSVRYCEKCEKVEKADFFDMSLALPFFRPEYKELK